ncbi:MAG TPA: pseudouridine synthase [Aggregatilineales bacterium]|nr:pseudouridine synthase [Anaerolineales bacterium]HRE46604.1 pseudouridine synthase [Aggregatilineales bacterium]
MSERLQKLISQAGISSRRDAETIIAEGRVTINGRIATLGESADPDSDDIRVDGARLRIKTTFRYIMLNKPMQVVTTTRAQDQEKRRTVRDLVEVEGHLYPVGRLDADSEGLVLLTDDGDLAEKLTHPRYEHAKVYTVTVRGRIDDKALEQWRKGVHLEEGLTLPVEIKVIQRETSHSILEVTMREGRKRQIRRIASIVGYPVQKLVRTHLATLTLGDLPSGAWRDLTPSEVKSLRMTISAGENREAARAAAKSLPRRSPGSPPRTRRPARPEGERAEHAGGTARPPRRPSSGAPKRSDSAEGGRLESGKRPARPPRPTRRPSASIAGRSSTPQGERSEQSERTEGGERPPRRPSSGAPKRPTGENQNRPASRRPSGKSTGRPSGKAGGRPGRKPGDKPTGSSPSGKGRRRRNDSG